MPIYTLQASDGRILEIEGPAGATEEELSHQASQLYRPRGEQGGTKYPQGLSGSAANTGNPLTGALETAASVGSGLLSSAAAGYGGLGAIAKNLYEGKGLSDSVQAAAPYVQKIQQAGTYQPRTSTGQEYTENVGNALNYVPQRAGQAVMENTEGLSPEARAALAAGTELVADPLNLLGIKGVRGAAKAVAASPYTAPRAIVKGIGSAAEKTPQASAVVTPETIAAAREHGLLGGSVLGPMRETALKFREGQIPKEGRVGESVVEDYLRGWKENPALTAATEIGPMMFGAPPIRASLQGLRALSTLWTGAHAAPVEGLRLNSAGLGTKHGAALPKDWAGNLDRVKDKYGKVVIDKREDGGPVKPGTYMVGENGPEILHLAPGSHGYVTPSVATQMGMSHREYGGDVYGEDAEQDPSQALGYYNPNQFVGPIAPQGGMPQSTFNKYANKRLPGYDQFAQGNIAGGLQGYAAGKLAEHPLLAALFGA